MHKGKILGYYHYFLIPKLCSKRDINTSKEQLDKSGTSQNL